MPIPLIMPPTTVTVDSITLPTKLFTVVTMAPQTCSQIWQFKLVRLVILSMHHTHKLVYCGEHKTFKTWTQDSLPLPVTAVCLKTNSLCNILTHVNEHQQMVDDVCIKLHTYGWCPFQKCRCNICHHRPNAFSNLRYMSGSIDGWCWPPKDR